MTEPVPQPPGADPARPARRGLGAAISAIVLIVTAAVLWQLVGRSLYEEYRKYREEAVSADESAPVGYLGLFYRRSYNDRPRDFFAERDGRKLLFAAKTPEGPDFYDITEVAVSLRDLDGGFGRDSIPGVDFPVFQSASEAVGSRVREKQAVFGLAPDGGEPRAYPVDLLAKVELVNDRAGAAPVVAVYDRANDALTVHERTVRGREVTFGTTGYNLSKTPLLYDRATRSLWMPRDGALACICGELKGESLPPRGAAERTTWGAWRSRHPGARVLVGNDRKMPEDAIPAE